MPCTPSGKTGTRGPRLQLTARMTLKAEQFAVARRYSVGPVEVSL